MSLPDGVNEKAKLAAKSSSAHTVASSSLTKEGTRESGSAPKILNSAPSDQLSVKGPANLYEQRLLKGAAMLAEKKTYDAAKQITREERLWRTDFKYPLIREEVFIREMGRSPPTVRREYSVADHLLVRFPDGISESAIAGWAKKNGFYIRHELKTTSVKLIATNQVSLEAEKAILAAFQRDFTKNPEPTMAVAERDYVVFPTLAPDDTSFASLWGMHNTGQTGGVLDADIDAPEAWDITTGSKDVLVAVIDTGLDRNHPDLATNVWKNPGEIPGNFVDDDGNGFVDDVYGWDFFSNDNNSMDEDGHGTHCAGTIGAVGNNRAGVVGVCWQVSLVGLRFLGPGGGSTSDAIECVNYATALGVDLTSNSWGGGGFSSLLKQAIDDAGADQILFVAAAGNDGTDNDADAHYPANYTSENVIAVASTTASDIYSSFSNFGLTTVDVAAPGSSIYSTVPGPSFATLSGTSMATPHVSGALALAKSIAPMVSAAELKNKLLHTVDTVPALAGRTVSGGRLNAQKLVNSFAGPYPLLTVTAVREVGSGNGDGIPNPGESFVIEFSVINRGTQPATNVVTMVTSSAGAASRVNIPQNLKEVGTLQPGERINDSNGFVVTAGADVTTPYSEELVFTLRYGVPQQLQVLRYPFRLYSSSVVNGRVTDLEDGSVLANATVILTGPSVVTATTNQEGRFSTILTDGVYQAIASAQGFLKSAAQEVIAPPGRAGLDFALSRPQLGISPASVMSEILRGDVIERRITLTNHGTAPLEWNLRARQVAEEPSSLSLPATTVSSSEVPDLVVGSMPDLAQEIPAITGASGNLQGVTIGAVATSVSRSVLIADLQARGAVVVTLSPPLTAAKLKGIHVIFLDDTITNLTPSDLNNLRAVVQAGAGLLCEADNFSSVLPAETLLAGTGIQPVSKTYRDLTLTDILPHPITAGVISLRELAVGWTLNLSGMAVPLVREPDGSTHAAVSLLGSGIVVVVGNEITNSSNFTTGDGRRFANQIIDGLLAGPSWLSCTPLFGTLAPGQEQDITLSLDSREEAAGAHRASLIIGSNIPDEPSSVLPVVMTILEAPKVKLSQESLEFGDVIERTPVTRDIIVTNDGTADLILQPGSFTGVGAAAFAVIPSEVLTVRPGDSQVLKISFLAKAALGFHQAEFNLVTNDPRHVLWTVPVNGTHVDAPKVSMSPLRADVRLLQGQTFTRTFTFKNTGKGILHVRPRLELVDTPAMEWAEVERSSELTIARGKSASVTVRFRAQTLEPGMYAAWLSGDTDDPDTPVLNGGLVMTVIPAPVPVYQGVSFGKTYVGQSQTQTLVLSNHGLVKLTLQASRGLNGAFQALVKLPMTILPGESREIPVKFAPTKVGEMNSSLVFAANVPERFFFVPVAGVAARLPSVKVTPTSLTVSASPGIPQTRVIKLSNTGGELLEWSLSPISAQAGWLQQMANTVHLAGGSQQEISLQFMTEQMAAGVYQSEIRIRTNDPHRPEVVVPVTLKVSSQSVLQAVPAEQNLGEIVQGNLASAPFELRNVGNLPLEIRTITSAHVELRPGWPNTVTLQPGESVPVYSSFQSAKVQNFKGALVVRTNSRVTGTVKLAVNAKVVSPATMEILPGEIAESVFPNRMKDVELQVRNEGDVPLNWSAQVAVEIDSPADAGSLATVLQRFNSRYASLTSLIPNVYAFTEGTSGYSITDGGLNMYDAGNLISTNLNAGQAVAYSDGAISTDQNLGNSSRYFTRKQPGLFVMAADLNGVSTLRFRGGLGADGAGTATGEIIHLHGYVGFLKRVSGSSVTSVNHLVILPNHPNLSHSFSTNTDLDNHDIMGLPASTRLYALVFSTGVGTSISDVQARQVMERFILAIAHDAAIPWLKIVTGDGQSLPDDTTSRLRVKLDATGLAAGTYLAAIEVSGNAPATPRVEVPVTLTVPTAPVLNVEPGKLDFLYTPVNGSVTQKLTLRNVGNSPLLITGATCNEAAFTCIPAQPSAIIAAGQIFNLDVRFSPQEARAYEGQLIIQSNSEGGTAVSIPLTASGIAAPLIRVSPLNLTLSTRPGVPVSAPITLENTGIAPLTWSISSSLTTGVLDVRSGTIAPGGSQVVTLTTASTAITVPGSSIQGITVSSNDPTRPQVGLLYTRIISAEPVLQVTPAALSFGTLFLPGTAQRQITLKNVGNSQLVISAASLPSSNVSLLDTTFPIILARDAVRNITVRYAPTTAEQLTGNLTFTTNNPITPSVVVPVAGQAGVPPTLSVSSTSLNVTLEEGQSFNTVFTIRNDGGIPLTWAASVTPGDSAPWLSLGQVSGTATAGGVSYFPVTLLANGPVPNTQSATVTLTSNAPLNGTVHIPVTLQTVPGELSVSTNFLESVTLTGVSAPSSSFGLQCRDGAFTAWTLSSNVPWIVPSRLSGRGDAEITLNYAASLAEGLHQGLITVTTENATRVLQVTRRVLNKQFSILQTDRRHDRVLGLVRGNEGLPSILAAINPTTLAIDQILALPTDVCSVDLTTDERTLYAVSFAGKSVSRVNLDDFKLVATQALPNHVNVGNVYHVQAGREGIVYYTDATENPGLHVFDFAAGAVRATFRLPGLVGIGSFVVAPDERTLYARSQMGWGSSGSAFLARVDCTTDALVQLSATSAVLAQDGHHSPILLGANLDSVITQGHFFTTSDLAGGPQGKLTGDSIFNASAYQDIWVTATQIIRADDGEVHQNLPAATQVTAFSPNQSRLIYAHLLTGEIVALDTSYLPRIAVSPGVASEEAQNVTFKELSWSGDPSVSFYDVYLGTDSSAVAAATIQTPGLFYASSASTTFSLGSGQLVQGQRYYWRIDLRSAEDHVVRGPVWSFRMAQAGVTPGQISSAAMPGETALSQHSLSIQTAGATTPWSLSSSVAWVTVGQTSGTGPATVLLSLNPSSLSAGVSVAELTLTSGHDVIKIPVQFEILGALNVLKMQADPSLPVVYALHREATAPYSSWLLWVDPATAAIQHGVKVGNAAVDFTVHVADDRLYTLVDDGRRVQIAHRQGARALQAAYTVSPPQVAVHASTFGRLATLSAANSLQLRQSTSGATVGTATQVLGRNSLTAVTADGSSLYAAVQQSGTTHGLVRYAITGVGVSFVTASYFAGTVEEPLLIPATGPSLIYGGQTYLLTNLNAVSNLNQKILAISRDGSRLLSDRAIYASGSPLVPLASLPFTTSWMGIAADGLHVLLYSPVTRTFQSVQMP
ncbi:Ig-like domain-containing protein [Prosthecobacter dejongeii]|uniref:Subtilisin family serine protease n=1 Tax=Prosthecobacter dejongeii TaxID=48465 RepID=A0A7W7YQH1_9BACT|nr:S8 family serine peptidase [Prosthecobacter dejongeii]MBB5040468.1 subtilisin family serine protease [Prosthecobacter dejongeii]